MPQNLSSIFKGYLKNVAEFTVNSALPSLASFSRNANAYIDAFRSTVNDSSVINPDNIFYNPIRVLQETVKLAPNLMKAYSPTKDGLFGDLGYQSEGFAAQVFRSLSKTTVAQFHKTIRFGLIAQSPDVRAHITNVLSAHLGLGDTRINPTLSIEESASFLNAMRRASKSESSSSATKFTEDLIIESLTTDPITISSEDVMKVYDVWKGKLRSLQASGKTEDSTLAKKLNASIIDLYDVETITKRKITEVASEESFLSQQMNIFGLNTENISSSPTRSYNGWLKLFNLADRDELGTTTIKKITFGDIVDEARKHAAAQAAKLGKSADVTTKDDLFHNEIKNFAENTLGLSGDSVDEVLLAAKHIGDKESYYYNLKDMVISDHLYRNNSPKAKAKIFDLFSIHEFAENSRSLVAGYSKLPILNFSMLDILQYRSALKSAQFATVVAGGVLRHVDINNPEATSSYLSAGRSIFKVLVDQDTRQLSLEKVSGNWKIVSPSGTFVKSTLKLSHHREDVDFVQGKSANFFAKILDVIHRKNGVLHEIAGSQTTLTKDLITGKSPIYSNVRQYSQFLKKVGDLILGERRGVNAEKAKELLSNKGLLTRALKGDVDQSEFTKYIDDYFELEKNAAILNITDDAEKVTEMALIESRKKELLAKIYEKTNMSKDELHDLVSQYIKNPDLAKINKSYIPGIEESDISELLDALFGEELAISKGEKFNVAKNRQKLFGRVADKGETISEKEKVGLLRYWSKTIRRSMTGDSHGTAVYDELDNLIQYVSEDYSRMSENWKTHSSRMGRPGNITSNNEAIKQLMLGYMVKPITTASETDLAAIDKAHILNINTYAYISELAKNPALLTIIDPGLLGEKRAVGRIFGKLEGYENLLNMIMEPSVLIEGSSAGLPNLFGIKLHKNLPQIMESMNAAYKDRGLLSAGVDLLNSITENVFGFLGARPDDYGTATILPHYFISKVGGALDQIGLGIGAEKMYSPLSTAVELTKKTLAISAGIFAYNYTDYEARKLGFRGPTQTIADAVAGANILLSSIQGKTQETKDYYRDGVEEIRAGRYWTLSSESWWGGGVTAAVPNWYRRTRAREADATMMWGSEDEYYAHSGWPSIRYPFAPIKKFVTDRYYLEKLHARDMPYPVTGEPFEPQTPWGFWNILQPIIKPEINIYGRNLFQGGQNRARAHVPSAMAVGGNAPSGLPGGGRSGFGALWGGGGAGGGQGGGVSLGAGEMMTNINKQASDAGQGSPSIWSAGGARLYDTYYAATEFAGFWGYATQLALNVERPRTTETARNMYSFERSFWDLGLGGGFIPLLGESLTEVPRRFMPRPSNGENYNPIRNNMPTWLAMHDTFLDLLHGDPYSKIKMGKYRLPGALYESLWNVERGSVGGSSIGLTEDELAERIAGYNSEDTKATIKGTKLHKAIEKEFIDAGMAIDAEKKIVDEVNNLTSYIDLMVGTASGPAVVDIKTTNARNFEATARGIPIDPHYISQLNYYMWATGTDQSFLIYVNSDDSRQRLVRRVQFNKALLDSDFAKLKRARRKAERLIKKGYISPFETYKDLDRLRILSDVAPFSQEFKDTLVKVMHSEDMSDPRKSQEIRKIKDIAESRLRGNEFDDYVYKYTNYIKNPKFLGVTETGALMFNFKDQWRTLQVAGISVIPGQEQQYVQAVQALMENNTIKGIQYDENIRDKGIIFLENGSLARKLIDAGVAEKINAPSTSIDKQGLSVPGLLSAGKAFEKFSHWDTPIHTKFGKRSAIESYEREVVYGKKFKNWTRPISDFIFPSMGAIARHDPLTAAGIGALTFGFLGAVTQSEVAKKAGFVAVSSKMHVRAGRVATLGATMALTLSVGQRVVEGIHSGKRWIPAEEKKSREIEQYIDRLKYVKYKHLYEITAGMLETANIDLDEVIARLTKQQIEDIDAQGVKVDAFTQAVLNDENVAKTLSNLRNPEFASVIKKALFYRQTYQSTMYSINSESDTTSILRALPTRERSYYLAFRNAPPDERTRILKTVSEDMRRILMMDYGIEDRDPESISAYFSKHYLPGEQWEGWQPSVDLEVYKVKLAESAAIDYHELQIPKKTVRASRNVGNLHMHKPDIILAKAKLRQLFDRYGSARTEIEIIQDPTSRSIDVAIQADVDETPAYFNKWIGLP